MRMFHTRKQLFAFFMPGFLIGILYVNFIAKKYIAEPSVFSDYFLQQYANLKIVTRDYMLYLGRVRILPFLLMSGLAFTKLRKISAFSFLVWTGFSSGMLLSMAVLSMGIKGSLLCIVGIFPHFLFYIPAYVVVLWYCYSYPVNQWNRQKTVFVIFMMLVGLIVEGYVNPVFMKLFLKTL